MPSLSSRCPTCMGADGNHNPTHIRHDNGGGHNEPCPRDPYEYLRRALADHVAGNDRPDVGFLSGFSDAAGFVVALLRSDEKLRRLLAETLLGEPVGYAAGYFDAGAWQCMVQTGAERLYDQREAAQRRADKLNASIVEDDMADDEWCVLEVRRAARNA